MKYRRNRLLLEGFIELPLKDFMIYQFVNRTEIVAIVTSYIAYATSIIMFLHCNVLIALIFIKIGLK